MRGSDKAKLSPDPARFWPRVLLKQGRYGAVVLTQDTSTMLYRVVRKLALPLETRLESAHEQLQSAVQRLSHVTDASLQKAHEVLRTGDGLWLVCDYVQGYPLDALGEARQAVPVELALVWASQLLKMLDRLHNLSPPFVLGVLGPSDVVIGSHGAAIVDLGWFERAFPQRAALLSLRGSHPFGAPEQFNPFYFDVRTDVYVVGALLFWLLTGETPEIMSPVDQNLMEIHLRHQGQVSDELATAVCSFIHYHLGQRPQSAAEALDRLRPFLPGEPPQVSLPLIPPSDMIPAPWLDGDVFLNGPPDAMVLSMHDDTTASERPSQAMKAESPFGARTLKTLKETPAQPERPPQPLRVQSERPPSLLLQWLQALDDWSWVVFHGDIRRLFTVVGIALVVMLAGVFLFRTPPAAAPGSPARLSTASPLLKVTDGKVYVRAAPERPWKTQNVVMAAGHQFMVSAGADRAMLHSGNGTTIKLSSRTLVTLQSHAPGRWTLDVSDGRAWFIAAPSDTLLIRHDPIQVECPGGGAVEVDVRPAGDWSVVSRGGTVSVKTPLSNSTLSNGQGVSIHRDAHTVQPLSPSELDPWQTWASEP